jgi:hypothetical protein
VGGAALAELALELLQYLRGDLLTSHVRHRGRRASRRRPFFLFRLLEGGRVRQHALRRVLGDAEDLLVAGEAQVVLASLSVFLTELQLEARAIRLR